MRRIILAVLLACGLSGGAEAATCGALPFLFSNGVLADATQVNANFASLLNCLNTAVAPLASPHFTGTLSFPDGGSWSLAGIANVKAIGVGQAIDPNWNLVGKQLVVSGIAPSGPVATSGVAIDTNTANGNVRFSALGNPSTMTFYLNGWANDAVGGWDAGGDWLVNHGQVTAQAYNKMVITQPANVSTLTIDNTKTFRVTNSLVLEGADNTTFVFPTITSDTVATVTATQNLSNKNLISPLASLPGGSGDSTMCYNTGTGVISENAGACTVSDPRLKTDWRFDLPGLDSMMSLHPGTYDWLDADRAKKEGRQIGLNYQDEIKALFPSLIGNAGDQMITLADGSKELIRDEETMDYARMTAVELHWMQEMQKEIAALRGEVAALKASKQR